MESTEYINSTEISEKVATTPIEEKQSNALAKNSILFQKCDGNVRSKRRGDAIKREIEYNEEELHIEEHLEQDGSATVLLPSASEEVDADDPEMELPLSEQQETVRDEVSLFFCYYNFLIVLNCRKIRLLAQLQGRVK